MKNKETFIPIAFILVALSFLYGGIQVQAAAPNAGRYGPSFFPNLCALLLLASSLLELIALRRKKPAESSQKEKLPFRLLLLFALSCLVPVLRWGIGFIETGVIVSFVCGALIRIPWPKGLLLSSGITLTVYCLFYMALKVQLPQGLF
ncbi:MAG: tripartite tricarboxylate transporter TctB family protein [Cloacibacillus sp.]|nr:tripartite tricarboxylate transporter TctB family protein [Cloacibacillus sp.]